MRSIQPFKCVFAALVFLFFPLSPSYASVVTLDSAARSAAGDTDSLVVLNVEVQGEQIGVYIESTVLGPQSFTLKVTGLREGHYDLYINYGGFVEKITEGMPLPEGFKPGSGIDPGTVLRGKSSSELSKGVDVAIPGTVADPVLMRCLESVRTPLQEAYDGLNQEDQGQGGRLRRTLQQAVGWVRSGIRQDQIYRSAQIVVAPAETEPKPMVWSTRLTAEETLRTMQRACSLLQQARDRMYDVLEDPILRNSAVAVLTPVDFAASYQIKSSKPHVDAKLTNNCDIPITGYISMGLPNNWTTTASTLTFERLESGKGFDLSFDLIPPANDAAPPDAVPIAANVTITQAFDPSLFPRNPGDLPTPEPGAIVYTAKLKLKVIARKKTETPAQ